jgi:hypothetical protein
MSVRAATQPFPKVVEPVPGFFCPDPGVLQPVVLDADSWRFPVTLDDLIVATYCVIDDGDQRALRQF